MPHGIRSPGKALYNRYGNMEVKMNGFLFAQYYDRPMMGGDWGWGWAFGMMLIWIIILIMIVVGIFYLVRGQTNTLKPVSRKDALEIAKERYAKGDIKREEFEQIKNDLADK